MDPQFMLTSFDAFMAGEPLTAEQVRANQSFRDAIVYAAAAYDMQPHPHEAVSDMGRAFLAALIDPLDARLDYLRADPTAGEEARNKRKAGAA